MDGGSLEDFEVGVVLFLRASRGVRLGAKVLVGLVWWQPRSMLWLAIVGLKVETPWPMFPWVRKCLRFVP